MGEAGAVWSGEGLSQMDLMHKDECICVDDTDAIVGHDSKVSCHRFVPEQPKGILHRAFSVFLFNPQGELLLQQRATDKITFPAVRNPSVPPTARANLPYDCESEPCVHLCMGPVASPTSSDGVG